MTNRKTAAIVPFPTGALGRSRTCTTAGILAILLSLSACQSAMSQLDPMGAWDDGGVRLASSRWGGYPSRLRPLDLTLEPGVPFGGCLVIETVKLGAAETGSGLIC
jgi:hypothetical protein